jgi:hypothetical protein
VAPGILCPRNTGLRVVSDTARAVARRGCLIWLDVDGPKGGASAAWIRRGYSRRSEPGRAPETRNATRGAPEGAPAANTAGGRLAEVPLATMRLTGAPLPHGSKEGNEGGAPRLTFPGLMNHVCGAV